MTSGNKIQLKKYIYTKDLEEYHVKLINTLSCLELKNFTFLFTILEFR